MTTKERPILFSGPMVRAVLEGKKTQTRRVVNRQGDMEFDPADPHFGPYWLSYATDAEGEDAKVRCPYGKPGDRLWVREAWRTLNVYDHLPQRELVNTKVSYDASTGRKDPSMWWGRYRHARFMPRWASRITLEITGVRVERLQEISEADARAEGITDGGCLTCGESEPCGCSDPQPDARDAFAWLWQSIYGTDSWFADPWVWVVEFKRVEVRP